MHTGGSLSSGVADGANFAHQSGNFAGGAADAINVISTFLIARGWVDEGVAPPPGSDAGVLLSTVGESGSEQCYLLFYAVDSGPNTAVFIEAWSDTLGTEQTNAIGMGTSSITATTPYWMTGDKDCFVMTVQPATGEMLPQWAGIVTPFAPIL